MTDSDLRESSESLPISKTRGRRGASSSLWWVVAAVVVTIGVASSRLLINPTFYFVDDTQSGTVGQLWRLGEQLLSGQWPILDPHAWTAGNYLAEGQWGLYNPLVWLIAIGMHVVGDPLVAITVIKIGMLAVTTGGVYLLARSFGARPSWAAAAGVLVPLGGFTVYMDAASWTTGLFASAVLPWSWWGMRRLVEHGRGPLAYLIPTAILVTFGYVFGVIVLVVVLAESLVRTAVRRDWRKVLLTTGAGVFAGLLSLAVYLPGVLTASVTVRNSSSIVNGGFLNADLTDVAAMSTATVTASIHSWGTEATTAPLMYTLWALPAIALFAPSRRFLRSLVPLLVVGVAMLLIVTGPDQVGPIRWPVRFMPYVVLVVVVAFAAIASDGARGRSARGRLIGALGVLAGASWLTAVNTPWEWRQVALAIAIQAVGIAGLWWVLYRPAASPRAGDVAATITALIGVVLVVPQMHFFPASPLPQLAVVHDVSQMANVPGKDLPGDAIVVGDIYDGWQDPATYDGRLIANQWYFSDTNVSSLYTVLPFRAYVEDLCADLRGSTCAGALASLWRTDSTTGEQLSTLLGVNTIVVIKSTFAGVQPSIPTGWRLASDGATTWVFTRDEPVATAGGVTWTAEGTRVTVTGQTDTGITLRVDQVGGSGKVVLSRLAWPGYSVDGAVQTDSLRGYLLTLDVSSASPGSTVVVEFRPPGWGVEVASLVIAGIALVAWPLVPWFWRRRPRRSALRDLPESDGA